MAGARAPDSTTGDNGSSIWSRILSIILRLLLQ